MKALCIRQPWPELIARGEKPIEFRSWRTKHRGPLAIVAGSRWFEDYRRELKDYKLKESDCPRSTVVCIVDLVDCVEMGHKDYHWVLENPRRVRRKSVKGKLNVFELGFDPVGI